MTPEKKIRSELIKMSSIMLVLIGLGIYAHDFVLAGLEAKLALNLSIFALAGLAAALAFRHVLSLKNEVVALKALQVDCGSIRRRPVNPYRHPAIVFKEPELLGQGYRIITEEFSKQGDFKISNATVQILLHDVDQRINDRKSTIMYFSGLMVFLGLLGAFMGLMKTVHSVSDLIGGMDLSGASGTDGMAKMIDGMKAPLNGMSVGFSSSLFGLMTSMVLGALERFMTSAMKTLRNEFEHYLSNLADLDGTGTHGEVHVKVDNDFSGITKALEAGDRQLQTLRKTVSDTADHAVTTRAAMGDMASAIARLSENVENLRDPTPYLTPIGECVSELARNQMAMLANFQHLYDQAASDRAQIAAVLGGMGATIDRMNTLNGVHLHKQLDDLAVLLASRTADGPAAGPPAVVRPGLFARWFGGETTLGLRRELRRMVLGHRRTLRRMGSAIDDRLARIQSGHDEDRKLLSILVAQSDDQKARIEALAAPDADGASPTLTGARMEMDILRRRLDVTGAEPTDAAPPEAPTSTGTPKQAGAAGGAQ